MQSIAFLRLTSLLGRFRISHIAPSALRCPFLKYLVQTPKTRIVPSVPRVGSEQPERAKNGRWKSEGWYQYINDSSPFNRIRCSSEAWSNSRQTNCVDCFSLSSRLSVSFCVCCGRILPALYLPVCRAVSNSWARFLPNSYLAVPPPSREGPRTLGILTCVYIVHHCAWLNRDDGIKHKTQH